MKKVICLSLALMGLSFLIACSSNTPGAVAEKYAGYIKSGKYEKFVESLAFSEEKNLPVEKLQSERSMYVALMKEKGEKGIEKKEGIKDIQAIFEEIAEDGKTAKVILKQTYGNGQSEEYTIKMIF